MKSSVLLGVIASLLVPQLARAETAAAPERSGFTADAGLGAGIVVGSNGDGAIGLSGLDLGMGSFVSRDVALGARMAATTVLVDTLDGGRLRTTSLFVGLAAQQWLGDQVFVGLGSGLAVLVVAGAADNRVGFAFEVRGGYNLARVGDVAIQTCLAVTVSGYEPGLTPVLGAAWQLGVQLF